MKKTIAIVGIVFSCIVIIFGIRFLSGSVTSSPDYAGSAPSYYDSGYASFGGDFYTYVNNNSADAAKGTHTIAANQYRLYTLMTKFFGFLLISLGGISACLFGVLGFEPQHASPVVPAADPIVPVPAAPAPEEAPAPVEQAEEEFVPESKE